LSHLNKFFAVGVAAAIAVTSSTFVIAAPIGAGSGQLALQNSAMSDVIDVSSRGRRNTAVGLGVLGGVLLGGALASGAYAAPPPPPPAYYVAPPPPRQQCWQQTGPYQGQGRWVWC
jgi:hypothetical protein